MLQIIPTVPDNIQDSITDTDKNLKDSIFLCTHWVLSLPWHVVNNACTPAYVCIMYAANAFLHLTPVPDWSSSKAPQCVDMQVIDLQCVRSQTSEGAATSWKPWNNMQHKWGPRLYEEGNDRKSEFMHRGPEVYNGMCKPVLYVYYMYVLERGYTSFVDS